jgi:hypothetical protein
MAISSDLSFRLSSACAIGDQSVRFEYQDGAVFDLDLAMDLDRLEGPLVDGLKNPEVFEGLKIEHGSLVFPTGLDYGSDVLRLWCENGGVADQTLTDQLASRHFSLPPIGLVEQDVAFRA